MISEAFKALLSYLELVSCPDPAQLTQGEKVWCYKHEVANEITERHYQ